VTRVVTLFGPMSLEGRILVELFMNESFCNTHVVVGVKAQLTFPEIVREFDIFPVAAPPDNAIIGNGVCAAVTINISSAFEALTPLGIKDDTDEDA